MTEEVEERALKEVERLERMPPASPEVVVVRTYLDWLISMPWSIRSEEKLDIIAAERILNEDHYGLKKVKERVLEFLAVRKLASELKGPILCFIGPPGVGKTSIGRSIDVQPGASSCASRWAACGMKARFEGTGGPTSGRCPAGSCRG
jgi:ATP-dependent Lon protease